MARKRSSDSDANPVTVKIRLTPEEHDLVRLAAAIQRQTISHFAMSAVTDMARRLTEGIPFDKIRTRNQGRAT